MSEIRLSALYRYPVKSLAGHRLTGGRLDAFGLEGDRRWMVVDREGGYITQRELPEMALISTRMEGDSLVLQAPGRPSLTIDRPSESAEGIYVRVWNDRCEARNCGDEVEGWLSEFLGRDCRLVYMADGEVRRVDPRFAQAEDRTAFSDGFPLLLISQASLDDLNRRLEIPLPMIRFRPNLVVTGCEPYAEDGWSLIRVGDISLRVVKPCARCKITTVDPCTAETGSEPLKTLSTYRRQGNKILFGQNLLHDAEGALCVGMPLEVLQRHA
jgi:uncharacterized protein